jgi:hypothetical protein
MPVDSAVKRGSAFTLRRLPWFRRFALPMPDGEIDQADRQQVGWVYAGILAGELIVVAPFADVGGSIHVYPQFGGAIDVMPILGGTIHVRPILGGSIK